MLLLSLTLMFGLTYTWSPALDAECVARDGRVGRCLPPRLCQSAYISVNPIHCRYSRGHGLRICCDSTSTYHDDHYSDDEPILFPSDPGPTYTHQYHPFTKPATSYNRPIFTDNFDYGPQRRPNYNEKRPYLRELPESTYESSRPNIGFHNHATSSFVFQERPNINNPQISAWEIPAGDNAPRTTPGATWSVQDHHRGTSHNTNKRVSQQKCEEFSRPLTQTINVLPLSIGAKSTPLRLEKCEFSAVKLIVGGEASQAGEFPHMAAIGFHAAGSDKVMWNCGGTLISELYVMTAGHCVNTSNGNPVVIRLGEINLIRNDDDAQPIDIGIERIIVHPNYFKSLKYNDIALIRLSQRVKFNKWIRPACLPNTNEEVLTDVPIATGWGRSEFAGKLSDVLMKVCLSIVDNNQCNRFYSTDNPGSSSFSSGILDTMICAGELRGGKDTCLGDSGGPLTISKKNNPCIHYVIGITSFGKMCGAPNSPGVYTRVSKYLSWIERVVWPE